MMKNKNDSKCSRHNGGEGFSDFIHLLFCAECRRNNTELRRLLEDLSHTSPRSTMLSDALLFDKAVYIYAKANPKPMSEWIWNLSGILILSCSVIFSFSSHYESMKAVLGNIFQIIVSLIWGVLVCTFICYYVVSHYKKVSRLNEYLKSIRNIHI